MSTDKSAGDCRAIFGKSCQVSVSKSSCIDGGNNGPLPRRGRKDPHRTDLISNLFSLGELEEEYSCFMQPAAPPTL